MQKMIDSSFDIVVQRFIGLLTNVNESLVRHASPSVGISDYGSAQVHTTRPQLVSIICTSKNQ